MAVPMNPVVWSDSASLHEATLSNYIEKKKCSYPFEGLKSNTSFLYSTTVLRRSIEKSRTAFLNLSLTACEIEESINEVVDSNKEIKDVADLDQEDKQGQKKPSKRISYKIKRSSSLYRTKVKVPIRGPTVAELASKFDRMIAEKKSILEDPKFAKFVKRVNSQKSLSGDSIKLTKKPSVKIKPNFRSDEKPVFNVKKPTVVVRRVSVKKPNKLMERNNIVHDKISLLNPSISSENKEDETDGKEDETKAEGKGNVKAAIEKFEKCKDTNIENEAPKTLKPKPKVPEKKFTVETMGLINKNSTKKFKARCNENKHLTETNLQETNTEQKAENIEVPVININIPVEKPKRCESTYELLNQKHSNHLKTFHSVETLNLGVTEHKPNTSFLWRRSDKSPTSYPETEDLYDVVNPPQDSAVKIKVQPPVPPRPSPVQQRNVTIVKPKMPEPDQNEKIYEELKHTYVYPIQPKYEDIEQKIEDDGYEAVNPIDNENKENIYEVLPCQIDFPPPLPTRQVEMTPPALPAKNSYYTIHNQEVISNGYESIGSGRLKINGDELEGNYEVLSQGWGSGSNRDSVVSSDQQSNSLYGRSIPSWTEDVLNYKTTSVSSSERSDEWEDLPDDDEKVEPGFIHYKPKVREKQKISRKTSEWSQQLREQWSKSHSSDKDDVDSYHHYESVRANGEQESHYESDSFDSDSDYSDNKPNMHDSGVDMGNTQLPDPPNNQTYVFTRLASAGKRMKRFITKNDITKSLSRMTKRKSRLDLENLDKSNKEENSLTLEKGSKSRSSIKSENEGIPSKDNGVTSESGSYQNVQYGRTSVTSTETSEVIYEKQSNKKGFFTKFRRSMSLSAESANELTQELTNKPKSTFYLTDTIDVDEQEDSGEKKRNSLSPPPMKMKAPKSTPVRPLVPPPPLPTQNHSIVELRNPSEHDPKRTTSWYAECGLFKNNDMPYPNLPRRPNTCWYAEVGLYQSGPTSTPSTSSTENSGNNINNKSDIFLNMTEEYYNLRNDNTYYNDSPSSITSNDSKTEKADSPLLGEMQQLLQDEPLYQLYDAALSESYCKAETLDLDYEEVSNEIINETQVRPSAMELILKNGNSVSITRTLWCEIPEVKQSAVLSTLSLPQKKLQEAKFEMMTSEASYLNSLNVLNNHFIKNLCNAECLSECEKEVLFGKIPAVKNCSEKLLQDLEKCWQDNILLHNICDVIKKHAEENFNVYVHYCENQVYLVSALEKIKDRTYFNEILERLEKSTTCQALTLYSFLMLPMQRITRWRLLLDAVLKRLCISDREYVTCKEALATINKIVKQCNEAARNKEREREMLAIKEKIDFGKYGSLSLITDMRYLIKSGPVTQMVSRGEDVKLTFGKRFSKVPLFLFLFNDLLLVTKYRSSEDNYNIIHYCPRSFIEVNVDMAPNLSSKDTQGRHLMFLTILENQEERLVEMLLSCNTDSDRERWLSALVPVGSQDPDETLYESWDCPQVAAIHDYIANQADELSLCRGDIIYVNRKMADGWYYGEKIRGGECGWFPSNYVQEIANPHVRARNLRQRYRLLAFSENYLKTKSQNE